MRNDSCRKCGNEMKTKQTCSICNHPLKFICKSCNTETSEQIHLQCILIDMDYKLLAATAL